MIGRLPRWATVVIVVAAGVAVLVGVVVVLSGPARSTVPGRWLAGDPSASDAREQCADWVRREIAKPPTSITAGFRIGVDTATYHSRPRPHWVAIGAVRTEDAGALLGRYTCRFSWEGGPGILYLDSLVLTSPDGTISWSGIEHDE